MKRKFQVYAVEPQVATISRKRLPLLRDQYSEIIILLMRQTSQKRPQPLLEQNV